MSVFLRLCDIYKKMDYRIISGIDASISLNPVTEYTYLFKNDRPVTYHLGISLKELYFFECLFQNYSPKKMFLIGNSFGWSSLALAFLNPHAQLVTLELGSDVFTYEWLNLTNEIAKSEGLNLKVIKGRSPHDVSRVIKSELGDSIEFAFIDGDHSAESLMNDFQAIHRRSHDDTLYFLHDIISFNLIQSLEDIVKKYNMQNSLLLGTTSGMALLHHNTLPASVQDCAYNFGANSLASSMVDFFIKRSTTSQPSAVVDSIVSYFNEYSID